MERFLPCETLPRDPGFKEGPLWTLALPRNGVSAKLLLIQDPHPECLVSWGIPMTRETAIMVCLLRVCPVGMDSGEPHTQKVLWSSSAERNQGFHVMAAAE